MFWSTLSITVSFISVFVGDTSAVCSWSDFTPLVYISGVLSCSPVPAPDTQGHLFGVGFDWEAALGDMGVSPPSRSGAVFSFHHVLCYPDSWKLESTGKCSRHHQFSSVTQSCPTLCNPMNCSTLGLLVHHQLPNFTQTPVHGVSDAIQP